MQPQRRVVAVHLDAIVAQSLLDARVAFDRRRFVPAGKFGVIRSDSDRLNESSGALAGLWKCRDFHDLNQAVNNREAMTNVFIGYDGSSHVTNDLMHIYQDPIGAR